MIIHVYPPWNHRGYVDVMAPKGRPNKQTNGKLNFHDISRVDIIT